MAAAHYKLDNLTVMIDNNGLQIDGTNDQVMSLGDLAAKLRAFGLYVIELPDGNDIAGRGQRPGRSHGSRASPSASWPTPSRARVCPLWKIRWAGTARRPMRSSVSRLLQELEG